MPPLRRTIALPQMDGVAVLIGQHLHFDVPRMLDVLFQIDAAVAEGRLGLGPGLLQGHLQHQLVQRHAHAAPAAAGRRLDQHRKADLVGQRGPRSFSSSTRPSLPGTTGTLASRANCRAEFLSPSRAMAWAWGR